MSDLATLEETLRADPDNHEAWLAYAAWLTEQGDARGELIVLEEQLRTRSHPMPGKLSERVDQIEKEHHASWVQGWSDEPETALYWRHGFVLYASFHGKRAVGALERLAAHPMARFLQAVRFRALPREGFKALVEVLQGTRVRELGFDGQLKAIDLKALVKAGSLGPVRVLDLSQLRLDDQAATVLAQPSGWSGLASLDLSDNDVGPEGVAALARSDGLSGLTALSLRKNRVGNEGAQALARAALPLKALDLGYSGVQTSGVEALACGDLRGLVSLDLHGNTLRSEAVRALAETPSLPSLAVLRLGANMISEDGASALAHATRREALRELDLGSNPVGDQGLTALSHADGLRQLVSLGLPFSRITDTGAVALAETPALTALERLDLSFNRVTERGATALVHSRALRSLTLLELESLGTYTGAPARAGLTVRWRPRPQPPAELARFRRKQEWWRHHRDAGE